MEWQGTKDCAVTTEEGSNAIITMLDLYKLWQMGLLQRPLSDVGHLSIDVRHIYFRHNHGYDRESHSVCTCVRPEFAQYNKT